MKKPKLTVDVAIRRYHATATYSHAGNRVVRLRSGATSIQAARKATEALLDKLEEKGIDPEFVAIRRQLLVAAATHFEQLEVVDANLSNPATRSES